MRSLNPKPPSSFGLQILSRDFQCIPFVLPPGLHQNCATAVLGMRKQDITWSGRAVTTDFYNHFFSSLGKEIESPYIYPIV